ncbi:DNA mismatch repair protein MutS, partial [candidate division bacterium WOR-3 4484_18]
MLLPKINELLPQSLSEWKVTDLHEVADIIDKTLVEDPPTKITEGGLIRDGANAELDELRQIVREGKNWIAQLEARERIRTGIESLKVGYNSVFGYYIEVTKPNLHKVPKDYIRKQTLVNAERFITPELKEYESKVLHAEDRIKDLEYKLYNELRKEVAKYTTSMQEVAHKLAELDVLASLAYVARKYNYVRP